MDLPDKPKNADLEPLRHLQFFTPGHILQPSSKPKVPVELIGDIHQLLQERKYKQAKEAIRSNHWSVDHPIRAALWFVLCRHHGHITQDASYEDLRKEALGDDAASDRLPAFVDPAYCVHYQLTRAGRECLERVLCVTAHSHPAVLYSPLLYPLASMMLHFLPEDQVYYCMCAILSPLHKEYVVHSGLMHNCRTVALLKLAKKYAKNGYQLLQKDLRDQETVEKSFVGWQWWIFKCLPFHYVMRVTDCFLMEGSKVLYRVALAILFLYGKHSGKLRSKMAEGSFLEKIIEFCQTMPVSVDKFLKLAFTNFPGLSKKEIDQQILKAEILAKSNARGRSLSVTGLPLSGSAYHLQVTSHDVTIKEHKKDASSRALSDGMIPLDNFQSAFITPEMLSRIWQWIPLRISIQQPEVIYSTNEHGSCLMSFFMRVDKWEPTILVVKTAEDEIFGAFCATGWSTRKSQDEAGRQRRYFGTGESFVFTLVPAAERFSWVGLKTSQDVPHSAKLFMASDDKMICVGGGNGHAIWLEDSLTYGRTERCDTFGNSPLCSNSDFRCKVVEVIGFK